MNRPILPEERVLPWWPAALLVVGLALVPLLMPLLGTPDEAARADIADATLGERTPGEQASLVAP